MSACSGTQNLHDDRAMLKRWKWIILLACGIFALALLWQLLGDREPSYKGHSLSHWTIRLSETSGSDEEAMEAIAQIGTNAIPFLLDWIQYEPPPGKEAFYDFLNMKILANIAGARMRTEAKATRATGTMLAFEILGANAAVAVKPLDKLANGSRSVSTNENERLVAVRATLALPWLGETALPPLLSALTNHHNLLAHCAAEAIGNMGTNALPAVPVLIQCIGHTNDRVAWKSIESLGKLKLNPPLVVSALVESLEHFNK